METDRYLPDHVAEIRDPVKDREWRDYAECLGSDPEVFFTGVGQSSGEAKDICNRCRVTQLCLQYALMTSQQQGTWGGMTRDERVVLKRSLRNIGKSES